MAKYSVTNGSSGQAITTSYKSLTGIAASSGTQALRRGKVYDILVGTNGTPADNYMQWDVSRMTSSGAYTAGNCVSLDTADASAAALPKINYTTEPTVTSSSNLFNVGVNQRASYRWVAAPGGELVYPATDLNGIVVRALSGGYTGTATATVHFEEQ
jgi:hypothetical protein